MALRFLRALGRTSEALERVRGHEDPTGWSGLFLLEAARTLGATDPAAALDLLRRARARGAGIQDPERDALERDLEAAVRAGR